MEPTENHGRETPAGQGPADEGPATNNSNRQPVVCPLCHRPHPNDEFHAPGGTRSGVCRSCIHFHASLNLQLEFAESTVTRLRTQIANLYQAVGRATESDYHQDVQARLQTLRLAGQFENTLEPSANPHVEATTPAHMPVPEQAPQDPQPAAEHAAAPHRRCSKCHQWLPVDLFRSKTGRLLKMCRWCRERDHRYQRGRRDRKKDQGGGPSEGGSQPNTGICV